VRVVLSTLEMVSATLYSGSDIFLRICFLPFTVFLLGKRDGRSAHTGGTWMLFVHFLILFSLRLHLVNSLCKVVSIYTLKAINTGNFGIQESLKGADGERSIEALSVADSISYGMYHPFTTWI